MEGFLLKKGRGESKIFGRRNWKKRWFILEGQYLTYFEDFDRQNNRPVRQKGVAVIRGCDIRQIPHQEKQFCFVVKHEQRRPIYLCAEKEKLMFIWIDALQKAAKGIVPGPKTINWNEYYDALNMPPEEEYTLNSLNKAYRKAALKSHPDKGGNVEMFKKVQEAFEMLQSKYEEEEQNKHYTTVTFTARIVKSPPPVGFGMVVAEDSKKGGITAKDIYNTIVINWISPEAEGNLQKGDSIIQIESDDIRNWSLARLVQRLSDFRVPVNSIVTFTFERRVRTGGEPEPSNESESKPEESFERQESTVIVEESQPNTRPPLQTRLSITFPDNSDSEDEGKDIQIQEEIVNEPFDILDSIPPENHRSESPLALPKPIVVVAQGEDSLIASLQIEIETLRKELHKVVDQRDSLRDELDDLRMRMEITIGERNEFLRQLGEAELECQNLERRERDALALVEQMADLEAFSAKQFTNLAINAFNNGNLSTDSEQYHEPGSVEHARKSALSAVALINPDGKFSDQKSGSGFLQRLENSVLRPYCDSNPGSPNVRTREDSLSPAPVLSLPQRLAHSRATRETEAYSNSPGQKSPVKRTSNFQQINRRVVSGLYIDSLRNESPKKSLVEKMKSPLVPSPVPAIPSPDRRGKLERSLSQPVVNRSGGHQSPYSRHNPPARPSRAPPPSPLDAMKSSTRTSSRPDTVEIHPKSGGADRGPQFYRDLLNASRSQGQVQVSTSSPSERYKSTTTESYLFSPPPPGPEERKSEGRSSRSPRTPGWG